MKNFLQGVWGLLRLNKPAAFFLIGWPTLAALWLAQCQTPSLKLIIIFTLGIIITRSAGCIINDLTDRKFDGHVERTKSRPLVSGQLSVLQAFIILAVMGLAALWLVLQLNWLCFWLALVGVALTILYPFCKRFLPIPQAVLAITFNWGIMLAFAAVTNHVPHMAWLWLAVNAFWTLAYDTQYALCDADDDQSLGLHSSALTFGKAAPTFIIFCQLMMVMLLIIVGYLFPLGLVFWCLWPWIILLFIYQSRLVASGERLQCLKAFKNNQWVGLIIFIAILVGESC